MPTLVALDDTAGLINLQASNDFGDASASATVRVRNVAPVVTSGSDQQTVEGTAITLTASFVDPGALDTHTAAIEWGDGTSTNLSLPMGARALSAEHKYLNQGLYKPVVVVRDDDGGEGSATAQVTVTNLPPALGALVGPPRPVPAGDAVEVFADFTDPGVLDVHTAAVSWDDGTTSAATIAETGGAGTAVGTHQYARPGRYQVTLVLKDDDNGSATASTFVVITGPPVK
jgi:PKD repeat protein